MFKNTKFNTIGYISEKSRHNYSITNDIQIVLVWQKTDKNIMHSYQTKMQNIKKKKKKEKPNQHKQKKIIKKSHYQTIKKKCKFPQNTTK